MEPQARLSAGEQVAGNGPRLAGSTSAGQVMLVKLRMFVLLGLLSVGSVAPGILRAKHPAGARPHAQEKAPSGISDKEMFARRRGTHRPIRLKGKELGGLSDFVKLDVVVGPDGKVKSATPMEGVRAAYPGAMAQAMTWKYAPFEKDGSPTTVHIEEYIDVVPPEVLPTVHHSFPKINDPSRVVMTLSRSGCFGFCPSYSVEIHGDGATVFKGEGFVVFA
ncbi:MAG TPA: DUF6438 domain-containing protein, partial [Candidatus Acidoferrum sp.]